MSNDLEGDRLETLGEHVPTADEAGRLAEWYKALGDPTRVQLLYWLLEAGEMRVGELASAVGAPESTVSHALRWLRSERIVRSRRDGRSMHYRLDDAHVRMLLDLGREHLRHRADHPERDAGAGR